MVCRQSNGRVVWGQGVSAMDDDAILDLLTRLARPENGGGQVIERAAIMAAGADSRAVVAWILAHDGEPQHAVSTTPRRGLHGPRLADADRQLSPPQRFVLPPGVL